MVPCYRCAMREPAISQALRARTSIPCLVALMCSLPPGLGQEPSTPPMPSDPKALMLLAARANSIAGADVQPWHLKATFQVFDWDGKLTNQGTYEEFWAGP